MSLPTPTEILIKAKDQITDPTAWCQGSEAEDKDGNEVLGEDSSACKWCLSEAVLMHTFHPEGQLIGVRQRAYRFLKDAAIKKYKKRVEDIVGVSIGDSANLHHSWVLSDFNDSEDTTHDDILKIIDEAIKLSKKEATNA